MHKNVIFSTGIYAIESIVVDYGRGNTPILPLNIDCSVYDSHLSSCAVTELDVSHCAHVAGVNCGGIIIIMQTCITEYSYCEFWLGYETFVYKFCLSAFPLFLKLLLTKTAASQVVLAKICLLTWITLYTLQNINPLKFPSSFKK